MSVCVLVLTTATLNKMAISYAIFVLSRFHLASTLLFYFLIDRNCPFFLIQEKKT